MCASTFYFIAPNSFVFERPASITGPSSRISLAIAILIVSVEHAQCFVAVHRLGSVAVPPDAGVIRAVVDMVAAVLAKDVGVHLGLLVGVDL